jgi:hypothetical protein
MAVSSNRADAAARVRTAGRPASGDIVIVSERSAIDRHITAARRELTALDAPLPFARRRVPNSACRWFLNRRVTASTHNAVG